jgi:hypothetical protein
VPNPPTVDDFTKVTSLFGFEILQPVGRKAPAKVSSMGGDVIPFTVTLTVFGSEVQLDFDMVAEYVPVAAEVAFGIEGF